MILLAANLAAAVALLLWSVRLIRTGVERAFLPELRRGLRSLSERSLTAAAGGALAAMVLQSSAAVAMMGGGFVASGMMSPAAALALLLGADLGSAAMAQVLLLPVQAVVPFLMVAGIALFLKAQSRRSKQIGRCLTGLALVLLSIGMLRAATAPIGANEIVQDVAVYLDGDLVSAFVIGALLAWVMHSSLAAVLTFATFAGVGLVTLPAAAALVIGANLGGAVVPMVLLSQAPRSARLVAAGNLLARGGVTLAFLAVLIFVPTYLPATGAGAAQQVVLLHLALNAVMLIVALPFTGALCRVADGFLPVRPDAAAATVSALDHKALSHPPTALACAQRELMRMGERTQAMLAPVMQLFREWDAGTAQTIEDLEDEVDRMHYETKLYVSQIREGTGGSELDGKAVELVAMANSIEEAADRIAVNLLALARKLHAEALSFSPEGFADLEGFHDQVVTNARLALSVLTTGDAEAARQLVAEKDRIRREEQTLQEHHLRRLSAGGSASVETTNIHQETLRLLKQINAAFSYVAYPIAEETGDLLGSRLVTPGLAERRQA